MRSPRDRDLCNSCSESFLCDLPSLFEMQKDFRLDKLDLRCRVCQLLSTLCRSDPAIACLKVIHIDLGLADDDEVVRDGSYHFEVVNFEAERIRQQIKSFGKILKQMNKTELRKWFAVVQRWLCSENDKFPIARIRVKVYGIYMNEERVVERYLRIFAEHDSVPAHLEIISGRPVLDSDSELNFSRIRNWLNNCLEHHPKCCRTLSGLKVDDSKSKIMIPKRLVSVRLGNGDMLTPPRVVLSKGLRGKYIALSYCWVRNPLVKLTRSSLRDLEVEVPMDLLADTIRDAVIVTQKLKIPYLWVDSLCIIQDDKEDWDKESKKMADIYQGALLTISALGARQGEGLFLSRCPNRGLDPYDRDQSEDSEVTMDCILSRKEPPIGEMRLALPLVSHGFRTDIAYEYSKSRWHRRGWVLQERYLSRRIIHFGTLQIYWECNQGVYAEDGSVFQAARGNLSNTASPKSKMALQLHHLRSPTAVMLEHIPILRHLSLDWLFRWSKSLRQIWFLDQDGLEYYRNEMWRELISQYSICDLTYQADKLPAIFGLSIALGQLTGGTFCEGLWFERLAEQLCWHGKEGLTRHVDTEDT